MNTFDFDLKILDGFNNLEKNTKNNILSSFNLNKYKFLIDELKKVYELSNNKEYIQKRITAIFKEGCLNFNIINSTYTCNIYIRGIYHVYFNKNEKKYYLYLLKKKESDIDEYLGEFILNDELIWCKTNNE